MKAFCRNRNDAAKFLFCAVLAANSLACRKSDVPAQHTQDDGNPGAAGSVSEADVGPRPSLSPKDVVRLQLEAMQNNDANDSGIAMAYRFVSPDFRKQTGTVMRFAAILRTPTYQALLGNRTVEYGPVRVVDEHADQIVLLEDEQGNIDIFLFQLIRLDDGPHVGCWMTNGIHPNSLGTANHDAGNTCRAVCAWSCHRNDITGV